MSQPDEHHDYWDARAAEYDALIIALEVERLRPITTYTRPQESWIGTTQLRRLLAEFFGEDVASYYDKRRNQTGRMVEDHPGPEKR